MPYTVIFDKLFHYYGPQGWWPADTAFEMMIGSILVQNTNWRNVDKALHNLKPFLQPEVIDQMPVDKLAELIRSSGFYNVKAKRIKAFIAWLKQYDYNVTSIKKHTRHQLRHELLSINGIGRETADVILLYAFDKPIFVVDAYARRIFFRLGYDMPVSYDGFREDVEKELQTDITVYPALTGCKTPTSKIREEKTRVVSGGLTASNSPIRSSNNQRGMKRTPPVIEVSLYNEFHALLVAHAKEHCKAKPICEGCPLFNICDRRLVKENGNV